MRGTGFCVSRWRSDSIEWVCLRELSRDDSMASTWVARDFVHDLAGKIAILRPVSDLVISTARVIGDRPCRSDVCLAIILKLTLINKVVVGHLSRWV